MHKRQQGAIRMQIQKFLSARCVARLKSHFRAAGVVSIRLSDCPSPAPGLSSRLRWPTPRGIKAFNRYWTLNSPSVSALADNTPQLKVARWFPGRQEKYSRLIPSADSKFYNNFNPLTWGHYSAGWAKPSGSVRRWARFNCHMRKPVMAKRRGRNPERNTNTRHVSPKPRP